LEECIASIIFDPDDGGSVFFQNIGICVQNNTVSPPKKTKKLVLYSFSGVPEILGKRKHDRVLTLSDRAWY
jgi:hypothetical protein